MHVPSNVSWTVPVDSPGPRNSGRHSTLQLSTYSSLLLELRKTSTGCCQQQHLQWRGTGRRWWCRLCILDTHCLSNRTSSRPASCGQMWRGLMQDSLINPCSSQTRGIIPDLRRFAIHQANSRRQPEQGSELACSHSKATRQHLCRQWHRQQDRVPPLQGPAAKKEREAK